VAYKVNLRQFAKIVAGMGDQLEEATIKGLKSAAYHLETIIPEAIQDTKPHAPIDNSVLINSHYTTPTERGALVGVDAPHAAFMEYGTRPHRPPFQPLADWCYRKGLIDVQVTDADLDEFLSRAKLGSKPGLALEGEDRELQEMIDEAIQIVLAIVGKIASEGIEPRHYMRRAITRFSRRRILEKEIQAELDAIGFGEVGRKVAGDLAEKAAARARAKKASKG
jgi:hypothetical protein